MLFLSSGIITLATQTGLDIPSLSLDFIMDLNKIDIGIINNRYKITIEPEDEPIDILEKICASRLQ